MSRVEPLNYLRPLKWTAARYAIGCQHDSAALKARQCRKACGQRAKNEPLTTNATLRRTARTTKYEDAICANARKIRRTASARKTTTQASQEQQTLLCQYEAET
jgi:hypothetical protein